ncbi:Uncharacterized protein DAT39_023368 [Clarias magur]|uniref:Uncharacterized protein n=1 Tax=Clarias magur TaxID=1594786 RepID=A0A8J4WMV5_CLAMG|nr:Uncharacterized protein DAT39_023368 [Clarias magur]
MLDAQREQTPLTSRVATAPVTHRHDGDSPVTPLSCPEIRIYTTRPSHFTRLRR